MSDGVCRLDGDEIRALRRHCGLSIDELGRQAKVDPSTISRIERGFYSGSHESHRRIVAALRELLPITRADDVLRSALLKISR